MPSEIRVLDCTLRDGGYYNGWDFEPKLVAQYLEAMGQSGIEVVELGFRSEWADRFYGPFAYTTDRFIESVPRPGASTLAVMVNAKDLLDGEGGPEHTIDRLFGEAERSPVEIVRIAAHFREAEACATATARLRDLGYRVGLNLMQVTARTPEELTALASAVQGWGTVEVLYFADSLGNMSPSAIDAVVRALRRGWTGPIGVHTHDNMGQALANSLAAIAAGVTWIDGTMLGMGRGAGNARIEHLLLELAGAGLGRYRPAALFHAVVEGFEPLRARYGWGTNLFYYLSAQYGVHPTYVQQMLSDDRYRADDVLAVLEHLKEVGGLSYSGESLQNAVAGNYRDAAGAWSAARWAEGRDVLLIAAGPSLARYRDAVLQLIERTGPRVVSLNYNDVIPSQAVDAYAISHPTRLLSQGQHLHNLSRPLVMPLGAVPEPLRKGFAGLEVLDYGMRVEAGKFDPGMNGCTVPAALVAPYALALAAAAGARRVLLAGFDGYEPSDPRHLEMNRIFELVHDTVPAMPIVAITPTTYGIQQTSVFAPIP